MTYEPLLDMDDVKAHLQITPDSMYDIDILKRASLNAEEFLGNRLRTPLRLGTYTEVFFVSPRDLQFDGHTAQLQTHAGFLKDVTIKTHVSLDGEQTDVAPALLDKERGIITLNSSRNGGFFTVTYTAGFEAGGDLPLWLETALLTSLGIVYNMPSNGVEARGSNNTTLLLDNNILDKIRVNSATIKAFSYVRG